MTPIVRLQVVTAEAFAALVDMMYTSTLMLGESNVMDILLAASHLHLNNVVKACKHYLTTRTLPMSTTADRPNHHHPQQEQQRHGQPQVADLTSNHSLAANANLMANTASSKLQRSFLLQQLGLSVVSCALGGLEEDVVRNVGSRGVIDQRASFPIRRLHKRKASVANTLSDERHRQRQRPSTPNRGMIGEAEVNMERNEGGLLSPDSHKVEDRLGEGDALNGQGGLAQDDPQLPSQSDSGHCNREDFGRLKGGVSKEEDMSEQDHQDSGAGVKIKSREEEEEVEEQKVKLIYAAVLQFMKEFWNFFQRHIKIMRNMLISIFEQ